MKALYSANPQHTHAAVTSCTLERSKVISK